MPKSRLKANLIAILTAAAAWFLFNFVGAAPSYLFLIPIYLGAPLAPSLWFSVNYLAARSQRREPAFRGAVLPVIIGVLVGCAMGAVIVGGPGLKHLDFAWVVALLVILAPSLVVALHFRRLRLIVPAVSVAVAGVATAGCHLIVLHETREHIAAAMADLALWNLVASAGTWWWACGPAARSKSADQLCDVCGYDLRGNLSGTCPECGRGVAEQGGPGAEVE